MTVIDRCLRCDSYRCIRSRRLCDSCYSHARRSGTLDQYPTIQPPSLSRHDVCLCVSPMVEPIPLWSTAQCGACGRKIADDRLRELGG